MPKGYWIAQLDVSDPEGYEAYRSATRRASRISARSFWCAAASSRSSKGEAARATCVIEFPDYETALACYRSPEYQDASSSRRRIATVDLVVIEGYDGPQPG